MLIKMVGVTNNLKDQVNFIIEIQNNTTTKILKNNKMENWKKEIKRLDVIRLKLGLNFNQIEVLTGINRGKIGRFFNMVNEPSLGFYLDVKSCLENEIKVDVNHKKRGVSIIDNPVAATKEVASTNDCECCMSGSLFLRSNGCKKSKEDHKF